MWDGFSPETGAKAEILLLGTGSGGYMRYLVGFGKLRRTRLIKLKGFGCALGEKEGGKAGRQGGREGGGGRERGREGGRAGGRGGREEGREGGGTGNRLAPISRLSRPKRKASERNSAKKDGEKKKKKKRK